MTLLGDVIGYGLAAARPAAGTEGRLYYSTDTDVLERDNGSTWDLIDIGAGAGVSSLEADGAGALTGAVTLSEGAGVTLTTVGNDIEIASGGGTTIGRSQLVYKYTVAGSDKASIDTGADTPDVGDNDWTGGDLLEVFMALRADDAGATAAVTIILNNDTSGSYDLQAVYGTNVTAAATASAANANWGFQTHGSGGTAAYPGFAHLVIPNYAGTTFNKIGSLTTGDVDATVGSDQSAAWIAGFRSTAAVTRLKVAAVGAAKLKIGSQLLIYKRLSA